MLHKNQKKWKKGQEIFLAKAEWIFMLCDFKASVLQMTF